MRTAEEPGEGKERRRKTTTRAISKQGQFCNFTSFHLVGKDTPATIISERREYLFTYFSRYVVYSIKIYKTSYNLKRREYMRDL